MNDGPIAATTADGVIPCPACSHPLAAHDAISRRYCAATQSAGASRGCICSGVVSDAGALASY